MSRHWVCDECERNIRIGKLFRYDSLWRSYTTRHHPITAIKLALPILVKSVRKGWNKIHLGTKVIYRGEEWCVTNGVSYPSWDIRRVGNRDERERVSEDDLVIVRTPANLAYNALYSYRFWCMYWSDIDVRKALGADLKGSDGILGDRLFGPKGEGR